MYFSPFIISTQFICCGSLLLLFSNNLSASFLSSPCYFCPSPSIFFLVFPFCPHFSRPLISLCLHICVLFLFFTFVLLPCSTLSDSLSNPVSLFLFSLSPSHQSLQKLLLEMGIGQEASEGEREREREGEHRVESLWRQTENTSVRMKDAKTHRFTWSDQGMHRFCVSVVFVIPVESFVFIMPALSCYIYVLFAIVTSGAVERPTHSLSIFFIL